MEQTLLRKHLHYLNNSDYQYFLISLERTLSSIGLNQLAYKQPITHQQLVINKERFFEVAKRVAQNESLLLGYLFLDTPNVFSTENWSKKYLEDSIEPLLQRKRQIEENLKKAPKNDIINEIRCLNSEKIIYSIGTHVLDCVKDGTITTDDLLNADFFNERLAGSVLVYGLRNGIVNLTDLAKVKHLQDLNDSFRNANNNTSDQNLAEEELSEEAISAIKKDRFEEFSNERRESIFMPKTQEDKKALRLLHKNGFLSTKALYILSLWGIVDQSIIEIVYGSQSEMIKEYQKQSDITIKRFLLMHLKQDSFTKAFAEGKISIKALNDLAQFGYKTETETKEKIVNEMLCPERIHFFRGHSNSLFSLAQNGYIDYTDLMYFVKNEDRRYEIIKSNELLSYYTPKLISQLIIDGKADTDFLEQVNEVLLKPLNNDEKRNRYFEELRVSLKEKSLEGDNVKLYLNTVLDLADNLKFSPNLLALREIKEDVIQFHQSGQIDDALMYRAFNLGFVDYTDLENEGIATQGIKSGQIQRNISPRKLTDELVDGKIEIEDVFNLYCQGKINIDEFNDVYSEYKTYQELQNEAGEERNIKGITELINQHTPTHILQELYSHEYLEHADIKRLVNKGVLTEEQEEMISDVDAKKLFDAMFGKESVIYSETEKKKRKNGKPKRTRGAGNGNNSGKENYREEFLEGIIPLKKNYVVNMGNGNGLFEGYIALGNWDYRLVILENTDRQDNRTYFLTIGQAGKYMEVVGENMVRLKDGYTKGNIRDQMKNAKEITAIWHNHVPTWGALAVSAMRLLSKKAQKDITTSDHITYGEAMVYDYYRAEIQKALSESEEQGFKIDTELEARMRKIDEAIRLAKSSVRNSVAETERELARREKEKESKKVHTGTTPSDDETPRT